MARPGKKDLPIFVDPHRGSDGVTRYYFRVGKGTRTRLPGAPGDLEFRLAYAAALAASGQRAAAVGYTRAARIAAQTIDGPKLGDIVERLLKFEVRTPDGDCIPTLASQAADEIKRLRNLLCDADQKIGRMQKALQQVDPQVSTNPDYAWSRWQGSPTTPRIGYQRALKLFPPSPCTKCGAEPAERHHIDKNPANNSPSNVKFLCRPCHLVAHGKRPGQRGRTVA